VTSAHDHGSLGEEAARLADAVQQWLRRAGADAPAEGSASHEAGASPECAACPVCQGLRLLRGSRPDLFEHLSDAAGSLAMAMRDLLGDAAAPRRPARSTVERIDLG
jgi:hypothetical protein